MVTFDCERLPGEAPGDYFEHLVEHGAPLRTVGPEQVEVGTWWPMPSPRMARPPDMWSSMMRSSASRSGGAVRRARPTRTESSKSPGARRLRTGRGR